MVKKATILKLSRFYQKVQKVSKCLQNKSENSSQKSLKSNKVDLMKNIENLKVFPKEEDSEAITAINPSSPEKNTIPNPLSTTKTPSFKIKTIRKLPKDYFVEYQKYQFHQKYLYKYYKMKRKDNTEDENFRMRNLMQTFQSFIAFTKSLLKTDFIPINLKAFAENYANLFKHNTNIHRRRYLRKVNKSFNTIECFSDNFFKFNIFKLYSNKVKDLCLNNVYRQLLKNGFQPYDIKKNLELFFNNILKIDHNYHECFYKEIMKFNFSPKFFDLDFLGNIVFSNINEKDIYINIDCVVFKDKLIFRTVLYIFIRLFKFFYVFDFMLRNIFNNSGKNLNYHITYQVQYNSNIIPEYALKELSNDIALEDRLFLSCSFQPLYLQVNEEYPLENPVIREDKEMF